MTDPGGEGGGQVRSKRTANLKRVIARIPLPGAVGAVIRPGQVLGLDRRRREVHVALDELVRVGLGDRRAVDARFDVAGWHSSSLLSSFSSW